MFHIILTFPLAHFLTYPWIKYFDTMNMFLVFIILGIGADDVFVFVDAWKQSVILYPDLRGDEVARMKYTLSRAARACFVTKFTTMCAFIAAATSPLMPTRAFGIFAAVMVALCWILVTVYYPAIIMIHHRHISKYCRKSSKISASDTSQGSKERIQVDVDNLDTSQFTKLERFFHGPFYEKVYKLRLPIFYFLLAFAGVMGYLTSQLKPATKQDIALPKSHIFYRTLTSLENDYPPSQEDSPMQLMFTYGLLPDQFNRDGFSDFDFGSDACEGGVCGKATYDTSLDFSDPKAQEAVVACCKRGAKISRIANSIWASCFMIDYKEWREGRNETFPAPKSEFPDSFAQFIGIPQYRDAHVVTQNLYFDPNDKRIVYASVRWDTGYRKGKFYAKDEVEPFYNDALNLMDEMNSQSPLSAQGYSHRRERCAVCFDAHIRRLFDKCH